MSVEWSHLDMIKLISFNPGDWKHEVFGIRDLSPFCLREGRLQVEGAEDFL